MILNPNVGAGQQYLSPECEAVETAVTGLICGSDLTLTPGYLDNDLIPDSDSSEI